MRETVKTRMKCHIMRDFIRVYTVCESKKIFRQKYNIKIIYNLTPSLSSGPVLRHLTESSITTTEINLYFITSPLLRIQ